MEDRTLAHKGSGQFEFLRSSGLVHGHGSSSVLQAIPGDIQVGRSGSLPDPEDHPQEPEDLGSHPEALGKRKDPKGTLGF
jgi:hypothetical protein